MLDHFIGSLHNMLSGSVILFQLIDCHIREVSFKLEYIFYRGSPERINTLCIISDNTYIMPAAFIQSKQLDDSILKIICVLELIYKQVLKNTLVFLSYMICVFIQ